MFRCGICNEVQWKKTPAKRLVTIVRHIKREGKPDEIQTVKEVLACQTCFDKNPAPAVQ